MDPRQHPLPREARPASTRFVGPMVPGPLGGWLDRRLDITHKFTTVQAWAYETISAPAVVSRADEIGEKILPHVPEGGHVLDVGAGGGKVTIALAERRPDLRVTGIDLSEVQVERARKASRHLGDRVRFLAASALELPFPDETFDGLLSCGSIKHWSDRGRGMAECRRVMKPGAPLAMTEVDRSCHFDDTWDFVEQWTLPTPLKPAFFVLFRAWVAGQSIDMHEAKAIAEEAGMREVVVGRIPSTALLLLSARR